jgi:hypothetical protein
MPIDVDRAAEPCNTGIATKAPPRPLQAVIEFQEKFIASGGTATDLLLCIVALCRIELPGSVHRIALALIEALETGEVIRDHKNLAYWADLPYDSTKRALGRLYRAGVLTQWRQAIERREVVS